MKWYIGQDVVCIKSHSLGLVKEGEIYSIKGLKTSCCGIYKVEIDIGIKHGRDKPFVQCTMCKDISKNDGIWWLCESVFSPLESLTDISEIEELLKEPMFTH